MIQICIFPNYNRDTGDSDVIEPENSTFTCCSPLKRERYNTPSQSLFKDFIYRSEHVLYLAHFGVGKGRALSVVFVEGIRLMQD